MKGNGKMMLNVGAEFSRTLMEMFIKVFGKMTSILEKVILIIPMEINILVIGKTEKGKEKEN
jgi:hypothetical protein